MKRGLGFQGSQEWGGFGDGSMRTSTTLSCCWGVLGRAIYHLRWDFHGGELQIPRKVQNEAWGRGLGCHLLFSGNGNGENIHSFAHISYLCLCGRWSLQCVSYFTWHGILENPNNRRCPMLLESSYVMFFPLTLHTTWEFAFFGYRLLIYSHDICRFYSSLLGIIPRPARGPSWGNLKNKITAETKFPVRKTLWPASTKSKTCSCSVSNFPRISASSTAGSTGISFSRNQDGFLCFCHLPLALLWLARTGCSHGPQRLRETPKTRAQRNMAKSWLIEHLQIQSHQKPPTSSHCVWLQIKWSGESWCLSAPSQNSKTCINL